MSGQIWLDDSVLKEDRRLHYTKRVRFILQKSHAIYQTHVYKGSYALKNQRIEKTARNLMLCILLCITACTLSSCGEEVDLMTTSVLDEKLADDTETPVPPPATLLAEMKQPEEVAGAPTQQNPARDTTPPTVTAHLSLYKNTNSGDVVELLVIANEAIAVRTSRVRFSVGGKRYGDPIVLTLVNAEAGTYTYSASFTVTNTTPAGRVTFTVTPKDTAGNKAPKITDGGRRLTLEPPPLSLSARLTKSGEIGSDVSEGETVTLAITANRDMTKNWVKFFVDGRAQGKAKRLSREQGNTYHASFVPNKRTPAGPITVNFGDGRDIAIEERLYFVKTHPRPPTRVGAPAIYTQWVDADGFPIVATDAVNPRALDEAAWTMKQMIGHRHGWLRQLGDAGKFFVVLEYAKPIRHFFDSMGRVFPEDIHTGEWTRGLSTNDITFAGEEGLLGYRATHLPGGYMDDYGSATIHEFAHTIHRILLKETEFNDRLINAYNHAKEQGLWGTSYVVENIYEYFAMGADIWFGESIPWLRKYVDPSRESLREYDHHLADLLEEVFGDRPWRWTPIRERLHLPHLQGYDPTIAPIMDFDAL